MMSAAFEQVTLAAFSIPPQDGEQKRKCQRAVDAEGRTKEGSLDQGACNDQKDAWRTISLGHGGPLDAGGRVVKCQGVNPVFSVQESQWGGWGDCQGLCVLSCRCLRGIKLCCHPTAGPMG